MLGSIRKAAVSTLAAGLLLAGASISEIRADTVPSVEAPPAFQPVDANGVNLENGMFETDAPVLSIGPADGGLSYRRVLANSGTTVQWRDNFEGKVVRHCGFEIPGGCTTNTYYSVAVSGLAYVA